MAEQQPLPAENILSYQGGNTPDERAARVCRLIGIILVCITGAMVLWQLFALLIWEPRLTSGLINPRSGAPPLKYQMKQFEFYAVQMPRFIHFPALLAWFAIRNITRYPVSRIWWVVLVLCVSGLGLGALIYSRYVLAQMP